MKLGIYNEMLLMEVNGLSQSIPMQDALLWWYKLVGAAEVSEVKVCGCKAVDSTI